MCECVCYCACFYYVIKLYVHVCVLERAKHSFFALPNPLLCSVMNKICLNQNADPIPLIRYLRFLPLFTFGPAIRSQFTS